MRSGIIQAIIAYTIWGLLPIYWSTLDQIPADEILAHRIIWSFVFVGGLIFMQRRWREIGAIAASWRKMYPLLLSGLLISVNWFLFIWAVNNGHVVETSIGYYLNPLVNVLLGVAFLREKPTGGQWLAIGLAALAVLVVAVDYGQLPWISLALAFSFGLYGLAKKRIELDASVGLFMETMIVVPIALLYLVYIGTSAQGTAWTLPAGTLVLLLFSGVATALPLLLFARAAKHLTLTTLAFIQYIGPTLTLFVSVFFFKERMTPVLMMAFALIWLASAVYVATMLRPRTKMINDNQ